LVVPFGLRLAVVLALREIESSPLQSYQKVISIMCDSDPDWDLLLDLDGESFATGAHGDYVIRFVVKRVPASRERPHGLSYSLTLHDGSGSRLVGFDNAHAPPARKGQSRKDKAGR
jgi:hypothetical protein